MHGNSWAAEAAQIRRAAFGVLQLLVALDRRRAQRRFLAASISGPLPRCRPLKSAMLCGLRRRIADGRLSLVGRPGAMQLVAECAAS